MSTAMRAAMAHAGIKTPEELAGEHMRGLIQHGVTAWGQHPRPPDHLARRDCVLSLMPRDMTRALIERMRPAIMREAADWLLAQAGHAIRDARPARDVEQSTGEGQTGQVNQTGAALSTHSPDAGRPAGGGQSHSDTQPSAAPAVSSPDGASREAERRDEGARGASMPSEVPPPRPTLKELADKQAARMATRVQVEHKLTRLDTFMIWDRKLGDCTVANVKDWARYRNTEMRAAGRDVRFIMALVSNLPSGALIRDFWPDPDAVDALYAKAEAEHVA